MNKVPPISLRSWRQEQERVGPRANVGVVPPAGVVRPEPARSLPAAESPGTVTTLGAPGRMIADLRGVGRFGRFRPEMVAAIRAEIAAGTFGGPADMDRTVDALLGEL